jgi:DNA repair exonuclease SbcCD ATPase subunit
MESQTSNVDAEISTINMAKIEGIRSKHGMLCIKETDLDDAIMKAKRIRNAEAARRFRLKKKEKHKSMINELNEKISQLEKQIVTLQEENKEHIANKADWITHQSYYVNVLENLRTQFKKQKEYIAHLENMLQNISPQPFMMQGFPDFSITRNIDNSIMDV